MKTITVFVSAVLFMALVNYSGFAQSAQTQAPRTMSYQGLILDAAKHPVTGIHHITVHLYDDPLQGSLIHSESFTSDITNGIFSLVIGSEQSIQPTLNFDRQYWVGVSVDDASELSPRTAFTSVPYAIHANVAGGLSKGATGAVTAMNGKSGEITIKGGLGTLVQSDGNTITISAIPSGSHGDIRTQATTVNSVTGTTNQVTASPTTGNVVLSLPQDIHSGASPTFAGMKLTNFGTAGVIHNNNSGTLSSSLVVNADIANNANIAYSKLNLATSIDNGDIAAGANIASSKLNLTNAITSGDIVAGTIVNSDINAAANISASKLNLTNAITSGDIVAGTITNSDINAGANISASKLNLTNAITSGDIAAGTIMNSDINAAANIAASKINLTNAITSGDIVAGTIVNSDINGAANIAYSKLNLVGNIVNADISGAANIGYNKLNLSGNIVNGDIAAGANIAASKLNLTNAIVSGDIAAGTIVNSDISAGANIAASKLNLTNAIISGDIAAGTIMNSDINAAAGIAYSKLNLGGSIANGDIAAGAAIADTKLATISAGGKVSNSATTASSGNNANTIVLRDGSGSFSANTINATLNGNAANVNGTVAEGHGGTNQTTYAKGDLLYASAANTLSKRTIGATGQVLTISAGVPVWSALSGVGVTSATGTANQVLVNGGIAIQTGGITLSLPQNIHAGASPTFAGMTLSSMSTAGVVHNNASGVLSNSLISDADVSATAAIVDTKLATISTAGKVANSATTAAASNTNNAIVARDGSGNFSAGTITANLTGNASGTASNVTGVVNEAHGGTNQSSYVTGDLLYASSSSALSRRTIGSSGDVLTVSGGVPVWTPLSSSAITSLKGTTNQVLVNGDNLPHTGVITLTTAQDIGTTSSPAFTAISLTGKATSASTAGDDDIHTLTTKDYVDEIASEYWNIGGNAGLNSSSNYFGTNDATDLVFKTNSTEALRLTDGGSMLLGGTSGIVPTGGTGKRMMWVPSLGAFRAGYADGSNWNSSNVGQYSTALGYGTIADGSYSFAMGYYAEADGNSSVALGSGVGSFVDGAVAMGSASQAAGINSVAIGDGPTALGTGSVAIGSNAVAMGLFSTAFGSNTTANGDYSVVMGRGITVGAQSFGYNSGSNNSAMNISSMTGVAYFGDVNLIIGNDDNSARSLLFYGSNNTSDLSGGFYSSFTAGTQSANISYILPVAQGATNSLMTNDGSGNLSWASLSDLNILSGSALHYDATNNRLGIGTTTPTQVLEVSGNTKVSGTITSGSGITTNGISMTGGSTVLSYGTVTAGISFTIPNVSVVKINDDAANTVNAVSMPSGSNGQIMYIYNDDAQSTSGDVTIASGAVGVFVYVDGWRKAN